MSADLDALDRGVLEAGQAAAEALSRIAALEAKFDQMMRAEAILRRAGMPEPIVEAADKKAARESRHLRSVL